MLTDALITSAQYLATIVPIMVAGIVIAELLIEMGWVQKIGFIVLPLTRFAHLRDECGVSFLTAFASPAAANTMLVKLYDSDRIDKRELMIASITNSFPAIVMHWRTLVPVLVPLLGMTGMIYILILTFVGVVKTMVVLFVGHFTLEAKPDVALTAVRKTQPPFSIALKNSLHSSKKTLYRILLVTIPTTIVVFILIDMGIFDKLSIYLEAVAPYLPIPAAGLPIIVAQFASKIAAYTVAGNLMAQSVLGTRDIIITMLIGKVLSSVMELRILMPYYLGIFGPGLGLRIMMISTLLRSGILVAVIAVLIVVW